MHPRLGVPLGSPSAVGGADLSTVLLLRGSFDSQAHWHVAVAHRALLAKGHAFIAQGSCFDLGCREPRAPQRERCFTTFAVHALVKAEGSRMAVTAVAQPPLAQPQRLLPRCVYRLGVSVRESHTLGPCRGRLWCYSLAATMAVTSPVAPALRKECPDRIVEAVLSGTLSVSLPPGWRRLRIGQKEPGLLACALWVVPTRVPLFP